MTTPAPLPYQGPSDGSRWEADRAHLKALAICHYVWGGLVMLFSCMGIIYIVLGVMMLNDPSFMQNPRSNQPPPPRELGWLFVVMGSAAMLFGWTLGILTIISGRSMQKQRRRIFSLVIAGVNCISFPLGTTLGVFTFIVLCRDSVKRMYEPVYAPAPLPFPPPS